MLRTLLSTEGPRLHIVGADDPVRPVPLSFRASARTGVGIRFPLPPSAREVAARSADGGSDIARQFLSPSRLCRQPLPAGALQRGAAALTGRRTPRAFVPLRSTAGRRPLRAVQRTCPIGRLALKPPFIPAGVSSRASEQSIPPVMQCAHLPFRRQQASSHPLTCHGMVPQASRTHFFRHNKTPRLSSWGFVLALPIFPGRLQPSIVSRSELNFRVRDGNGWTLALISTNYSLEGLHLQNRTTKEGIRKA